MIKLLQKQNGAVFYASQCMSVITAKEHLNTLFVCGFIFCKDSAIMSSPQEYSICIIFQKLIVNFVVVLCCNPTFMSPSAATCHLIAVECMNSLSVRPCVNLQNVVIVKYCEVHMVTVCVYSLAVMITANLMADQLRHR